MAKINAGKILSVVMVVILASVLLQVLGSVLPTMTGSTYDLFTSYNATQIGTSAEAFADTVPGLLGWFFVIAPFGLVAMLVLGLFRMKGRR